MEMCLGVFASTFQAWISNTWLRSGYSGLPKLGTTPVSDDSTQEAEEPFLSWKKRLFTKNTQWYNSGLEGGIKNNNRDQMETYEWNRKTLRNT